MTSNLMGGLAVSWLRAGSRGEDASSGSRSTLDSYQLTLYSTYRHDQMFVNGQLGGGYNRFSQRRAIDFLGETASAHFGGHQIVAQATLGYDIPTGNAEDLTVTPLAALRWLRVTNHAYTESGAGLANQALDRVTTDSVSHDLGAKVTWSVRTDLGVVKPEVQLAWVHDYRHGPIPTSGVMAGQSFTVNSPRPDSNAARLGLALSLSGDSNLSLRTEYNGEVRVKSQTHTGLVKAIWGF